MGAQYFEQIIVGKSDSDAFWKAVQQAQYDHGHSGYSGTLAEKDDFVVVEFPKKLQSTRWKEAVEWIKFAEHYNHFGHSSRSDESKKEAKKMLMKIPKAYRDWAIETAKAYDDKWGPAVMLPLTGKGLKDYKAERGLAGTRQKAFVVLGWASS